MNALPATYPKVPLGALFELKYGAALPDTSRSGMGYPVFGSNGVVGKHSSYFVEGQGIVVGRKGSVGQVCWSNESFWPIDTAYYVALKEQNSLRWLYWMLASLNLKNLDSATGVPGLNRNDVYVVEIPRPEPPEQSRIAAILDTVDAAIAKVEELITKLKQVRVGLLHDLLTRGLDENGQLRDPIAHPERFKGSPFGHIPCSWEIKPLGELAASAVDGPFGSNLKTEHYINEPGVRVVRLQNVGNGVFDDTDKAFVSHKHAFGLQRHEVIAGDLLVASMGDQNHPLARSCLYPSHLPSGIVKADCFRLRMNPTMAMNAFVMLFLNCPSTRGNLNALGQGVTRDRVNLTTLLTLPVLQPQVDEQEKIAKVLASMDAKILDEEGYWDKLHSVKSGLMTDLLTGRVRVPDDPIIAKST